MKPTFVVADDHPFVLMGVTTVLEKIYPDYDIVEASDYPSLLTVLDDPLRDFVLIIADLNMPGSTGISGIKSVQQKRPDVPVMVISGTESQNAIDQVMAHGVIGYMFKSFSTAQMEDAIMRVMAGDTFTPQGNSEVLTSDEFATTPTRSPDLGAAALNQLPMGVIIVDTDARVVFVNKNADDIVVRADGIRIDGQKILRLDRADESRQLHGLIQDAGQMADHKGEGGVISVTRPSCLRDLSILVVPLTPDQQAGSTGAVAVFVTDPEQFNEPPTAVLARLYGLTEAEARVLQALIIGKKLETVAEDNNVSMNTVRSHLKQVFRKTGTNRQPELISLVLNSSAYVASTPVRVEEEYFE